MTLKNEIEKLEDNMRKFEEIEDRLQADYYVKVNGAKNPERVLPSDEEIKEEEKLENELAKEIALSLMRLKNEPDTKIVIKREKSSQLFTNVQIEDPFSF